MKKYFLLLVVVTLISCGKSQEEEMLYNYQKDSVQSAFNMNVDDLDFQIELVEKKEDIVAKDSAEYYREKLGVLWFGEDYKKQEVDTLQFDYVIKELESARDSYQEIILLNIKAGLEYKNYEWKDKRDDMIDAYSKVLVWKRLNEKYLQKPDSVLSEKYLATYSIKNPLMSNAKQTFNKYFYTDSNKERFIKEEMVE